MNDKQALIRAYRRDRRNLEVPNFIREDLGSVVRYSPVRGDAEGFICFTNISAAELDLEIERHAAHFRRMGVGFEWKVYGSDEPEDLGARLAEAGFEQGEPESLMVYDVAGFRPREEAATRGIDDVRQVSDIVMLEQIASLQEKVWRRSFPWLLEHLRSMWNDTAFYAAYHERQIVGAGWIEYPKASRFAELHGGAVLPEFRGRGVYSRLFELRMLDARDRGFGSVAVDAAPMSRPILEAKGFEWLDSTYPMTWSAH